VVFDIIARALRARGLKLIYLQNITDIEDKIIARAQKDGVSWKKVARTFEHAYLADMAKLKISSPDIYARASDHIVEIIAQIKALLNKQYAYITSTGVYFSVERFKEYGKLSHQRLKQMKEAVRINPDPTKKHFADFALWKFAQQGEPWWPSPWGKGRPGWHIEDTAITHSRFGPQYEIHGSALDLIFPHHESEIAQAEAAFGKKPFVKLWMHSGFVNIRGEKMSKSLGNIITLREILDVWPAEVFRMFVARAHYRSPIDYDEDLLKDASQGLGRIEDFVERLGKTKPAKQKSGIEKQIRVFKKAFWDALEDDFHTPRALAAVFDFISYCNPFVEENKLQRSERKTVAAFLKEVDDIFGMLAPKRKRAEIPAHVIRLVQLREKMRLEKKFSEADAIRIQLTKEGWVIEDTSSGPRTKKARG